MNNSPTNFFSYLEDENIHYLGNNYKIIEFEYLDPLLIKSKMSMDNYFQLFPLKKKIVNNMVDYYITHRDKEILKKINYLCNEKEKICICNMNANEFRKIYDGIHYEPNSKYICWIKN
jgi:hypothetical protein